MVRSDRESPYIQAAVVQWLRRSVFDTEIAGSTLRQRTFLYAGQGKHRLQTIAYRAFTSITYLGV